jgi:hypothetical protein
VAIVVADALGGIRRWGGSHAWHDLFASLRDHYFWTALELRVLLPDPPRGSGFWFVSVNRSRSDGLRFVGRIISGKLRGEAEKGMAAVVAATKSILDRKSG